MTESAWSFQDDVDIPPKIRGQYIGAMFRWAWRFYEKDLERCAGPVRTLKDFTPEERAALEKRHGCPIKEVFSDAGM